MLMININTNSTTAVAISASLCRPVAYAISITMLLVSVLTPLVMLFGIIAWLPATITTAIVSPIALPILRIIPDIIPLFAAGITVLKILLSFVAPSAREPS